MITLFCDKCRTVLDYAKQVCKKCAVVTTAMGLGMVGECYEQAESARQQPVKPQVALEVYYDPWLNHPLNPHTPENTDVDPPPSNQMGLAPTSTTTTSAPVLEEVYDLSFLRPMWPQWTYTQSPHHQEF